MTFEKKCLVEPSDIIAVQFECAQCHGSTTVPIASGVSEHAKRLVMDVCKLCQTPWGLLPNSAEHRALCDFAYAIEGIAKQMEGRNVRLKLEIACPDE